MARHADDRFLQPERCEQSSRNKVFSFVWQQPQHAIAPSLRRFQHTFRMPGEMFAVFLFVPRHRHLISARQNAQISELNDRALPFSLLQHGEYSVVLISPRLLLSTFFGAPLHPITNND